MTLGDLVKDYREKHNISMEEFSKMSNLSKGYISMLENNTNPRSNKPIAPTLPTIRKIAVAMDVEVDFVLKSLDSNQEITLDSINEISTEIETNINEVQTNKNCTDVTLAEYDHIKKYRDLDDAGRNHVDTVLKWETDRIKALSTESEKKKSNIIPMRLISYYYKNASAGTGELVIDTLPEKDIEIPDIPEYRNVSYAIGVNGESMEPVYHDGDVLLVETTRELKIGDIGIFLVGNECFVKKMGNDELISLNGKYKNIPLDESARIWGKVIDTLHC